MDFSNKYISASDKAIDTKSEKAVLSNDAFAIGEMIDELIKKIEHLRLSIK